MIALMGKMTHLVTAPDSESTVHSRRLKFSIAVVKGCNIVNLRWLIESNNEGGFILHGSTRQIICFSPPLHMYTNVWLSCSLPLCVRTYAYPLNSTQQIPAGTLAYAMYRYSLFYMFMEHHNKKMGRARTHMGSQ